MKKNANLSASLQATGLIFSNFDQRQHVVSKEHAKELIKDSIPNQKEHFEYFSAGLDTAYSTESPDTIAMSFIGITNKGNLYVLDEKVYNNKNLETPIAPSDTVINYVAFLERNRKEWGFARNVFVDSADQATLTEFKKYKRTHTDCLYVFNNAYKKIENIDRINLQLGWMSYDSESGKKAAYFILNKCIHYIGELETYSWREDKDNTPEDKNDHMINSVQYAWIPHRNKIGIVRRAENELDERFNY